MSTGRSPIRAGMRVVGDDGRVVGDVRDVHDFDFIMIRSEQPPLYVPFKAVDDVSDDLVELNIPADEVDTQDWAEAPSD